MNPPMESLVEDYEQPDRSNEQTCVEYGWLRVRQVKFFSFP